MKQKIKRSILPFLIVMGVAIVLIDFGNGAIDYEHVSYEELPDELRDQILPDQGPDGGGVYQLNRYTYAFIGTVPGQKANIIFVGNASDGIGKEVRYSVSNVKPTEEQTIIKGRFGEYALHVIRFEKRITTPFGFFRVDE